MGDVIDTRYHVRSAHGRTIVVIDHLESARTFAQGRYDQGVTGCTIHKVTITEEPVQWEPN